MPGSIKAALAFGLLLSLFAVRAAHAEIMVQSHLVAVDQFDFPTSVVTQGSDFELQVYVQDVRDVSESDFFGVFSAYLTVAFDGLLTPVGLPSVDPAFSLAPTATAGAGEVTGGGARGIAPPPGQVEQLLFTVQVHANTAGETHLTSSLPITNPPSEWGIYGRNEPLTPDLIELSNLTLTIVVPEPPSVVLALAALLFGGQHWASKVRAKAKCRSRRSARHSAATYHV